MYSLITLFSRLHVHGTQDQGAIEQRHNLPKSSSADASAEETEDALPPPNPMSIAGPPRTTIGDPEVTMLGSFRVFCGLIDPIPPAICRSSTYQACIREMSHFMPFIFVSLFLYDKLD